MNTWWKLYGSTGWLSDEDRVFLSLYTEEAFQNLAPAGLFVSKHTKTTIAEALDMVKRWIDTGVWSYYDIIPLRKEVVWRVEK